MKEAVQPSAADSAGRKAVGRRPMESTVSDNRGSSKLPFSARGFRQATSLKYDLVGSTALMEQLGAERYSVTLLDCHARFAAIVKRWGGVSDQPQGNDGVMCYFGVLHAREDTVRSSLFSALDLIDEAGKLGIQIRIGLATGEITLNDGQYTGATVHLAARLQELAQPGQAMASGTTAELAKPYFLFDPLPQMQAFKGFSARRTVFKVERAKSPADRHAPAGGPFSPLLGREAEILHLTNLWDGAAKGTATWLHLTGEAGIGKTRLVSSFGSMIEEKQSAQVLVCRCFPETKNRAFGPIIDMLERWFQIQSTDDAVARQSKLAQGIASRGAALYDHMAVSYLLGLPMPENQSAQYSTPQEPRRRFIMRTMVSWLINRARNQPTCFVLEDLQWADPSTLEYLQRLKKEGGESALLVLLTERTEQGNVQVHPLADKGLQLARLDGSAVREMIGALSAGSVLSRRTVDSIEAKSDGIPLFVEMSTRMVLENRESGDMRSAHEFAGDFPIPATVRDLLMQRLDNLGPARPLAQLCSAIGREFPHQLLLALCDADVASMPVDRMQAQLASLLRSGLLLGSDDADETNLRYHFRHALVHEVAYQSMWATDRRQLHHAIAQAIEARLPDIAAGQPEVLAHHYQACGALAEGAQWHRQAARKYKADEAHAESLAHLANAKALLLQLPGTPARYKSELDIELTMAGQLIATKGYGSPSAGESYLAALALAQNLKDKKSLLRAQLGLEAYYLMRADFGQAHAYLTQAQHTAKDFDDALTRAQCLFALANVLHHQGHAHAMQELCDQCVVVCRQSGLQTNLVQSPEVMSLMYSSVCLWEMGQVDLAVRRAREGVEVAEDLGQRLGLGQALGMQAMVLMWCGELEEAERISERAIAVCQAGDHEMWSAHARLIHGCCVSELGDPQRGLELMDSAYELWVSTGTIVTRTFYLALRAPACAALGRLDDALQLINEACRIVKEHGERYYEPEVLRIKGELLLLKYPPESDGVASLADGAFSEARTAAQMLGYQSLALRIATSMARRCQQQGETAAAIDLLQNALAVLTEGQATRDQTWARALLAQLGDSAVQRG